MVIHISPHLLLFLMLLLFVFLINVLKILRESIPFKVFNEDLSKCFWLKGDFPGPTQEKDGTCNMH